MPFVVVLAVAFVYKRSLFETPIDAWGDAAVNGLSVMRAEHLQQLVGNYSRVGFHHPGPGFMYILAAGEVFFYHLLGLAPAPYNGQLLGVSVYVAASVGAVCLIVRRQTMSWVATALVLAVVFTGVARIGLLGDDWFPFLYVSAYLVMVVAGIAVAAGRTVELPLFVLAGGLLAHGHASFLMFVGATTVVVGISWWRIHRGRVHSELRMNRVAWVATLVAVGLLCLPALADLVLHFPGQWPAYMRFALHSEREPRTWGEIITFVGASWTESAVPFVVYAVAATAGAGLLLTERRADRRRMALTGYAMLAVQSLLYLYYVARGVDYLTPFETYGYVGYFYQAVPLVLVLIATAHAWLRISELTVVPERPAAYLGVVLAVAVVVGAAANSDLGRVVPAGTTYAAGAEAIKRDAQGASRPIVINNRTGEVWATGAGLGLALNRIGAEWCIAGVHSTPVMFEQRTCSRHEKQHGFVVALTDAEVPAGVDIIWHDAPSDPKLGPGEISAYAVR